MTLHGHQYRQTGEEQGAPAQAGPRAPFSPHRWASSATQEGSRVAGDQAGWALSGPNTTPCSCSLCQPISAWADRGEAARGRLRTAASCVPDPRACAPSLSPMNTSFVVCTRHHARSLGYRKEKKKTKLLDPCACSLVNSIQKRETCNCCWLSGRQGQAQWPLRAEWGRQAREWPASAVETRAQRR